VADFRKAVKAENPTKLSSVDASDLLVYKNKAAFAMKERKSPSKKTLFWMVSEVQRRKL
jgi:hypothetical protein